MNGDFRVQMSRTRVEKLQRMLPTETVGIDNILEGKSADADKRLKERLPRALLCSYSHIFLSVKVWINLDEL